MPEKAIVDASTLIALDKIKLSQILCKVYAVRRIERAPASLSRSLRAKGIIVPSADASIASPAIFSHLPLYIKDDHSKIIAEHSRLVLYAE